jgi:hypothetical protein
MMNEPRWQAPTVLTRWQRRAWLIGLGALLLLLVGAFFQPVQFFRAYLLAFLWWTGLALGCLGVLMMQHLTGGAWGLLIRRPLEAAALTLPLLALLFVPLAFGAQSLYVWSRPAALAADEALREKQVYLNLPFFLARTALYFTLWCGLAWLLSRWSQQQDRTGAALYALRMQRLSGPGLFGLAVTASFAMIDWVMSLEPHWYSTIYSVVFIAGELLAAFAFAVLVLTLLERQPPLAQWLEPQHYRALGSLLLTFVMLWAYCAFSQFMLIYYGNLREEIPWYLRRLQGGWGWVAGALLVAHFFLPFFLLLSEDLRSEARRLGWIAGLILMMRVVDLVWLVNPAFAPGHFFIHWMDVAAWVGVGGLWLALFLTALAARPLLPLHDPYQQEDFAHEAQ